MKEEEKLTQQPKEKPLRGYSKHGSGVTTALILIFAGIIFLLNNFGVLPWSVWAMAWKLWPLILVILGVQTLFGKSWLADFLIFLFAIAILFFAFWFLVAGKDWRQGKLWEKYYRWIPQEKWNQLSP